MLVFKWVRGLFMGLIGGYVMRNLPKIELHCHLDGSVRANTVVEIARREGIDIPTYELSELEKMMGVRIDCESLVEYLKCFDISNKVMQSPYSLERIAYELMEDASRENVKYIEIRFGPNLHIRSGMTTDKVIESVLKGIKRAELDFDIKGNLILSNLRHHTMDVLDDIIESGKKYIGKGVVGLDLCAAEEDGFCEKYTDYFKKAREYGYRITIHAGEAGCGKNVLDAVELLGAERIGHGVYIHSYEEAYKTVKNKGVTLEMCPTSNIQTKAVDSFENHPIMDFMKDGIKVSISTDNRTVSATDMTNEMELVAKYNGMTDADYWKIYMDTVAASFACDAVKLWLLEFVNDGEMGRLVV